MVERVSATNYMGGCSAAVVSSVMGRRGSGSGLSINLFSEPGTASGDNAAGAPGDRREAVKSCQLAAENASRPHNLSSFIISMSQQAAAWAR